MSTEVVPSPFSLKLPWLARLDLDFRAEAGRTVLAQRHIGPLLVQRPLYPEGPGLCHAILLHPPGGIAGGDELEISIEMHPSSHALITMPGATRWYKAAGLGASQRIRIRLQDARLEWLPTETIVFDEARPQMELEIELEGEARYLGWEILCLGRSASGERFRQGTIRRRTTLRREGRLLWNERSHLAGDDPLLSSNVGLHGCTVAATLLLAGERRMEGAALDRCRSLRPEEGARAGVTSLPDLIVAHYLGHSSESARRYLMSLWQILRPLPFGREAVAPRIWST